MQVARRSGATVGHLGWQPRRPLSVRLAGAPLVIQDPAAAQAIRNRAQQSGLYNIGLTANVATQQL